MCHVHTARKLPERVTRAADRTGHKERSLPTAFAVLEAELALHALPQTSAPPLVEITQEQETAEAAA
jgi:hypothetical protein